MRYVMLFIDTDEFERGLDEMSDEARQQVFERVEAWFAEHAPKMRGAARLQGADTVTTVRLDGAGSGAVVTDGPFIEGKEVIRGYAEIEVPDLDEALRMARSWPGCPIVEIRPVEFQPYESTGA